MAQMRSYENRCIIEGEGLEEGKNPGEGIFWNKKVSKDLRHPLKSGYRIHSGSQEEKMGEKKMKPTI